MLWVRAEMKTQQQELVSYTIGLSDDWKDNYEMRIGLNLIEQKGNIGKIQCRSKISLMISHIF
jgi:hypothetical protein